MKKGYNKLALDKAAIDRLRAFLSSDNCPKGSLSYDEFLGFSFAVACSPHVLTPSEWLPQVFGEQDDGCQIEEVAKEIMDVMMALHDQVNEEIMNADVQLPDSCKPHTDTMSSFAEASALGQWSNGFLMGHTWLEEVWDDLPEDMDEEVGSCVMVLSFFANESLAKAYYKEFGNEGETFEQMAQLVMEDFHDAMISYADIGRSLRSVN